MVISGSPWTIAEPQPGARLNGRGIAPDPPAYDACTRRRKRSRARRRCPSRRGARTVTAVPARRIGATTTDGQADEDHVDDDAERNPQRVSRAPRSGGERDDHVVHEQIQERPVQGTAECRPSREEGPPARAEVVRDGHRFGDEKMERESERRRSCPSFERGPAQQAGGNGLEDSRGGHSGLQYPEGAGVGDVSRPGDESAHQNPERRMSSVGCGHEMPFAIAGLSGRGEGPSGRGRIGVRKDQSQGPIQWNDEGKLFLESLVGANELGDGVGGLDLMGGERVLVHELNHSRIAREVLFLETQDVGVGRDVAQPLTTARAKSGAATWKAKLSQTNPASSAWCSRV
jgi:hypothetical protein